jgi:AP-1 complex subunit sigma 1/2
VYRRYASLFFIAGCASTDNELITLEVVHRYVEQMDKYYGNVCEVRIAQSNIPNFELTPAQLDIVC